MSMAKVKESILDCIVSLILRVKKASTIHTICHDILSCLLVI